MPWTLVGDPHWNDDRHTVRWVAVDGQETTVVSVSEEALMDKAQVREATKADLLKLAERFRSEIAEAANESNTPLDRYGGGILVKSTDLARH